jgi:asparagine synthase (glutamine-hydrolysing)
MRVVGGAVMRRESGRRRPRERNASKKKRSASQRRQKKKTYARPLSPTHTPSLSTTSQPFVIGDTPGSQFAWALNSEIYNHDAIKATTLKGVRIVKDSKSDSAIIGHLIRTLGDVNAVWDGLDGIFACVVVDEAAGTFTAARDAMGVCPLYWGRGGDGSTWFASEMKALQAVCETFEIFPPGHVYRSATGVLEKWYQPPWLQPGAAPTAPADETAIHDALVAAVVKRLMSDAPLGVLLSGGLDSSLVAAIAARHLKEAANAFDTDHPLHTFSIGIAGSPDLVAARAVADHLGTQHHEFTFTVQEGLDAVSDLIYYIESYEQVRAAVPMYLLSRKIKALGFKVVLSGEGADEIFGGYLYFHKAPSAEEFHAETIRKVTRLHQWDVLRANKAPFAFGLEPRVPFLDRAFLDLAMQIDPAAKMCDAADRPDGVHPRIEKYILRKAFDGQGYLPEAVLWRQKEQFSDGVGYDWVDGLKAYAARVVSDAEFDARADRFPVAPPTTKEYYLLRSLFEAHYPSRCALDTVPKGLSIACSTPEAVGWDPDWAGTHEISGRAMKGVHDAADGFVA